MWDEPDDTPQQDLDLKLLRVGARPIDDAGTLGIMLETTRGPIEGVLQNAPETDERFFKVPKVIGGDEDSAG